MRRRIVLIVGETGPTTTRLKAHLTRRGLRAQTVADCGAAMETLYTSQARADGEPLPICSVVLDVERAGFGAHAFREMLLQDFPGVSVLELPPDDAGPEDVGLLEAAIVQGLRERGERTADDPTKLEESFEVPLTGYKFEDLNSRSSKMIELFELIPRVAQTDSAVLIRGETGTGKELVAAAIHRQSKRKDAPFFTVNCGALTETLLESELFGHEKGAFTGAVRKKKGYFELATGGTLFLDELGTISTAMQVRLLRVLERMEVRRVGGSNLHKVDVRIVAATNAPLEEGVEKGTFREDLYYRLNVVQLQIPALRERPEDVPLLADLFIEKFADKVGRTDVVGFDPTSMACLKGYSWPGNVRELEHVVERAVIMTHGPRVREPDLPQRIRQPQTRRTAVPTFDLDEPLSSVVKRVQAAVEREYLRRVLRRYRGHVGRAAQHAGVNRRTLYNKMQAFNLRREDFK